jgi:hypothetical protein
MAWDPANKLPRGESFAGHLGDCGLERLSYGFLKHPWDHFFLAWVPRYPKASCYLVTCCDGEDDRNDWLPELWPGEPVSCLHIGCADGIAETGWRVARSSRLSGAQLWKLAGDLCEKAALERFQRDTWPVLWEAWARLFDASDDHPLLWELCGVYHVVLCLPGR